MSSALASSGRFLLDTNVVSEWVRPAPNIGVASWLHHVDEDRVFLSVVTLAEIRRGIELMQRGRRRDRLTAWLEDELPARFDGRLLDVDRRAADQWGVLMARSRSARFALATIDGFIAATARAHGLTLVTRNVRDFDRLELSLFDPWEQPGP